MNLPPTIVPNSPLTSEIQDVREPDKPFIYKDESDIFNTLVTTHGHEVTKCTKRRTLRKNRLSVLEMRTKKQILNDETVIPDRTIDTTTRREKAPYIKYIEQPTVVLSFSDPRAPGVSYEPAEKWYTDLVRWGDWKMPEFKLIDSLILHGAGYVEVVYSPKTPSRTTVEYIRRDHLVFPEGTRSIQACTRVYRKYEVTKQQFGDFVKKFGFDKVQAKKITENKKTNEKFITIYKGFMRDVNGIVNVAWRGDNDSVCDDWLRKPMPHTVGVMKVIEIAPDPKQVIGALLSAAQQQPQPVNPNVPPQQGAVPMPQPQPIQPNYQIVPDEMRDFPLFVFPYHVEEDEVILDVQGRAALDIHTQDALTALWSGTVNGTTRASRFYPTRKAAAGEVPKNKELFELKHGHVFEGDYTIFQPNWPNTIAISAANALSTKKSAETGAVDFAAMNRQDTAKTATELNLAREEADSLGGVNISLYSRCKLQVESLRFAVIISHIAADAQVGTAPEEWTIAPPPGFDLNLLVSPTLVLGMAADAQVVRRAQRQSRFLQYYPVAKNSPYALPYLETMLQDMFPDEFVGWQQKVQQQVEQADVSKQLLTQAAQLIMQHPGNDELDPAAKQVYAQFLDNVGAAVGTPKPQQATAPTQPPQQELPQE